MQILHSSWLIKMLQKSGTRPEARLLALFDILDDWLDAPQIKENLAQSADHQSQALMLKSFLSAQAQEAGAAMPEMLAEQLLFLITSAIKAYTEEKNLTAIQHAKQTAKALIAAQCEKEKTSFQLNNPSLYAAFGLLCGGIILGAGLMKAPIHDNANLAKQTSSSMFSQTNAAQTENDDPKQTADMFASMETMRGGDCQFIEALQIPDADKKIYLENVVGGQVPTNAHDQMIALHYLQKIRCNYSPMLMKNSTN